MASAVATGLPYRGSPVVGAVGEMASMKRRKLWKTGEDGLCCSSSAIQTRLGPSSLLEERSKTPIVCFDRILTCRIKSIKSICSPAKVGLVVTDLITSPVVSWRGWETPPPAPQLSCHSLLNHGRVKTSLSVVACYFVVCYALFTFGGWIGFSSTNCL